MQKRWLLLLVTCLILGLSGCKTIVANDPNTGEEIKTYELDTALADKIESGAEVAVTGGGMASPYLPWLAPFVGIAAGALATWKRIRPKLEEATAKRDLYYLGGEVLADTLDNIKKDMPDVWVKISPYLDKAKAPVSKAEDAIRGFRHLDARS